MKVKSRASGAVVFIVLLLTAFIFMVPFLWTLLTSIKPDSEIYTATMAILPKSVTIDHYVKVVTKMGDFAKFFRNSVVSSFWSILAITVFAATMGYSFAKCEYRFKGLCLAFVMLVLTLPYVIYLIPIYLMESRMNMINTVTGLILPYIATNLPMAVFIMRGQYANVPNTLSEAAMIDGCNAWQVFRRIVLPCVKPGLATVIIYTFINVWGEFTYARTLTSTAAAQTLPVGITFLQDEAGSWAFGTLSATIIISLIPVLILFLAMQKYFVKGIMEGALKG